VIRVALRGIRAHVVRFALSVLAVALGVAFVAGTFALRSMLSSTFSDIVATTTLGDAYVRGSHEAGGPSSADLSAGTQYNRVPLTLVDELERVDGVAAAIPDLQGPVVLVGADGTAVQSSQAPSFAFGYDPRDRATRLVAGRAPRDGSEIGLESQTLRASGLALGDPTRVVVGGKIRPVTVVGELGVGAALAGATVVFLDPATAQAAFAPDGDVAHIAVNGDAGVTQDELVRRLAPVVQAADVDARVVTGDAERAQARAQIMSLLGFVTTFLLVFAAIALFVGAFIIANTFAMWVRQRMRELALLRAVGASPLQVFASIVLQAALVGVVGAALGLAGGLGLVVLLRTVLANLGMHLAGRIPVDGFTVVVSVLVGTAVSVVAAAIPARRAALVPPVEALRDEVTVPERSLRRRALLGLVVLVVGIAGVLVAVRGPDASHASSWLGAGAAGVLLGVLLVSPVVARSVLRVLGAPAIPWRPVGRLARGNVTRNPRRTANTAGALMIGMALVGAAAVIAATTQASTRAIVEHEATTDFILRVAPSATVPQQALADVRAVPGVRAADAFASGGVLVRAGADAHAAGSLAITGIDPAAVGRSIRTDVVAGDFPAALRAGEVAVQRSTADDRDWTVGDRLTLVGTSGQVPATIGAVIDSPAFGVPLVVGQGVLDRLVPTAQQQVTTVFVTAEPGTDLTALRAGLTDAVRPYLVVSVLDSEQFVSQLADQVNRVLVILYALLGLSVVIAVLGIVNTLALSVIERTREIGLLRAVGLGRLQLGSTITVESVLTAVFGTAVGLVVGVALASTLPRLYADQGLRTLAVPWGSLGLMLVLAVVVGVLAAAWPAVRAARLPVLEAVSVE
jgi:putative ABC transport system permease protein